jgi:hypothetical protein
MMYGIFCEAKSTTSRPIKNESVWNSIARPANVIGHNEIQLGAWWPYRLLAEFAGAHGGNADGIYHENSDEPDIAYAVCISGGGTDNLAFNSDNGDSITYTGPDAHKIDAKVPPPSTNHRTAALRRSAELRKPVRVLRGSNSKYSDKAAEGYRYDGLYEVKFDGYKANAKGGLYEVFKLERLAVGSDALPNPKTLEKTIQTGGPTERELKLFKKFDNAKKKAWKAKYPEGSTASRSKDGKRKKSKAEAEGDKTTNGGEDQEAGGGDEEGAEAPRATDQEE